MKDDVEDRSESRGGRRTGERGGKENPSPPSPYTAPALEKGLDILELLADASEGLSQNQVAARLGRSIGEIFRMLEVLERRGWLSRSTASGTYRLSMRMFELAHRQPQIKQLVAVALPLMQELARTTRQSNHLVVHHDCRILVVAQVDSPEAMGFAVRNWASRDSATVEWTSRWRRYGWVRVATANPVRSKMGQQMSVMPGNVSLSFSS